MLKYLLIIIAAVSIFWPAQSFAQELKATVTVNMDQLTFESRSYVNTLQRDLENYIATQKFTKANWEGEPIQVNIQIYLTSLGNNNFGARALISSTRRLDGPDKGQSVALKFYDTKWSFQYNQGANLSFNTLRYDRFTTFIDYYMTLVIGFDLDSYGELDGNKMFDQAKSLVSLGISQNADGFEVSQSTSDFSRFNLVNDLTNIRFEPFRKLLFAYYADGLDQMAKDRDKALKNLAGVIKDMADFKRNKLSSPSVLLQLFFDSKAQEISTLFNGSTDNELFEALRYLDPSNGQLWQDAIDGKAK